MVSTFNSKFIRIMAPLATTFLGVALSGFSPWRVAVFEGLNTAISANPVTIKMPLETTTLVIGQPSHFRINLEIDKDFRIFMDEVNVRLANQNRFKIKKHQGQPPNRELDPNTKKEKDFLQGKSTIDIEFIWSGKNQVGELPLDIQLKYEACTAKICANPKVVYLSTKVNVISSTEMRLPSSLPSKVKSNSTGVQFQKYSEKTYKKAIAEKKPIMIDFHASWCESCERFKKEVFNQPEAGALSADMVTLSVDLSDSSDETDRLREKFGVRNLPNVLFINNRGKINHELTVNEFEEAPYFFNRLQFFLND